ncbi:hypothetical protein [Chitiniphilus eburneus]|uniref:Uncharacterized protein n=1 Tax=Chitiniphilus eburneus TaxID=2571148 RepID=A0A4U0Q3F1_9NEIS|nr:hypothetical protein [Chitiniphilus eburneus]TJZ75603.1 hypothetical protein FAZ21_06730 [Chitiniphilus eburneus]
MHLHIDTFEQHIQTLRDGIRTCDGLIQDYLMAGEMEEVEHIRVTRARCLHELDALQSSHVEVSA